MGIPGQRSSRSCPFSSSLQCFTDRFFLTTQPRAQTLEESWRKDSAQGWRREMIETNWRAAPKLRNQDKYCDVIFKKSKCSIKIYILGTSKVAYGGKVLAMYVHWIRSPEPIFHHATGRCKVRVKSATLFPDLSTHVLWYVCPPPHNMDAYMIITVGMITIINSNNGNSSDYLKWMDNLELRSSQQ